MFGWQKWSQQQHNHHLPWPPWARGLQKGLFLLAVSPLRQVKTCNPTASVTRNFAANFIGVMEGNQL